MVGSMFGWSDLRKQIKFEDLGFVCPVEGCSTRLAERQTVKFRPDPRFSCAKHGIVFSPSTFEYQRRERNMLWGDYGVLGAHTSKRESRVARDNSEDAVTWNVFRFLERERLLVPYLSALSGMTLRQAKAIFWSHDRETGKPWEPPMAARTEFELTPSRGSEPDLIVLTDRCLFIIEAKLTTGNNTVPSSPLSRDKYVTGGGGWWSTAFVTGSDYAQIAEQDEKYELMRFWLLGTWMSREVNLDFRLINLLRDQAKDENDIEARFGKHLPEPQKGKFQRATWEGIRRFVQDQAPATDGKAELLRYFREKTVGYRNGVLQKAFRMWPQSEL